MADQPTGADIQRLVSEYDAAFGEAGDFDTWLFPEHNTALRRMALKRGSPVTEADLEVIHQALYGEPLPELADGAVT